MTLAPLSLRGRRSSRSRRPDRSAQQREQAAACRGAQYVENRSQNREGRTDIESQKGHRDHLAVLDAEKDGGGQEQDDDGQINPAHGGLICRGETKSRDAFLVI